MEYPGAEERTADNPLETLDRDEEGFLLDATDWYPELMEPLAAEEDIELDAERLAIVQYVRDYFERNLAVPEARTLLKHLKATWGEEKATRRYLYKLFPHGYGQQACKIAGMRKPRKLMLDV